MEHCLFFDIVNHILSYLDKNSSFNFLNTIKIMGQYKQILYNKYVFRHTKIENDKVKKHIKHLKIFKHFPSLTDYTNLISLELWYLVGKQYNDIILKLPNEIQSLTIINDVFNHSLDILPEHLTLLYLSSGILINQSIIYLIISNH